MDSTNQTHLRQLLIRNAGITLIYFFNYFERVEQEQYVHRLRNNCPITGKNMYDILLIQVLHKAKLHDTQNLARLMICPRTKSSELFIRNPSSSCTLT